MVDFHRVPPLNSMNMVCRLCLSEDGNKVPIFDNNNKHAVPLPIQIMSCAQIQVYANDGLPSQACDKCIEKVELWFEFKGVCTRSDEKLRQLIIKKEAMPLPQWEDGRMSASPKPEETSQNSSFCQYENSQPQEVEVPEVECDVGFASDRFEDSDSDNSLNNKDTCSSSRDRRRLTKVQVSLKEGSMPSSDMYFSSLEEESASDGDADWDEFKCEVCDKVLKSDAALKKHKLNHARKRKFPCTICGKAFLFKNHQIRHERNLHGKDPDDIFQCTGCDKKFTREFELKAHFRTHSDNVTFECEFCNKVLDDESSLSDHIKLHMSDRPHICETCGKTFVRNSHLKKHLWTHSNEKKPHRCSYCGKSFLNLSSLQDHLRTHTGEKPYLCTHCGKSFSQAPALIMHEKIHATGRTHSCKYCPKSFTSAVEVSEHMKDNHSGEKPFTCGTCGKTFAMQIVYLKHVKRHESLFLCNVCGKTFSSKQGLKRHVRIHTGEKPYLCQYCNTYFRTSAHLVEHVRIHTGDRPYACETCGKSFARRTHLQQHVRSHTGEKPYVCKYCGKPWASSSNLAEHVRIHTGEKPYMCQICGQAFGKRSALQEHLKGHSSSEEMGANTPGPASSPGTVSLPLSSSGQLSLADEPWASSNLVEHVRIHSGEKPFICQICGQAFGERSVMQDHMKGHSESAHTSCPPSPSVGTPLCSGQLSLTVPNVLAS